MQVSYCEGWFRHLRRLVGPMSPEKALQLHRAGKGYAVIIGDPAKPDCFIEINLGVYGVSFLDDLSREYLMYTFHEVEDKLFLKEVTYREFKDASASVQRGAVYRFSPDGLVSIEKSEEPFKHSTVTQAEVDVSENWERKPDFGQYEDLLRKERLLTQ